MSDSRTITVPDIGDFKDVEIIDVLVQPGDTVEAEQSLISLESDKATMDIPAPGAGTVTEVLVKVGDKVSEGSDIVRIEATEPTATHNPQSKSKTEAAAAEPPPTPAMPAATPAEPPAETPATATDTSSATADPRAPTHPPSGLPTGSETATSQSTTAHASPSVRRFARELGIDLALVSGSGRKGRITKDDVKSFTKTVMSGDRVFGNTGGYALPEIPAVDFSKFGPIETQPLSRLKRLAGQHLQRSWLTVPQVTQFNEADITDLEQFRHSKLKAAEEQNVKLTLVSFLLKAVVVVLEKLPEFNTSLAPDGEALIYKNYYHVGVAVNTDEGLIVPVIRDVDQKGLFELAAEITEMSERARSNRLKREEMEGGCFTISSLGGVGGSFFTPIVNTPEVGILGVSRASTQPVYEDGQFVPKLILPFALSYDHRVIDGVAGAQFTEELRTVLTDIRHILL